MPDIFDKYGNVVKAAGGEDNPPVVPSTDPVNESPNTDPVGGFLSVLGLNKNDYESAPVLPQTSQKGDGYNMLLKAADNARKRGIDISDDDVNDFYDAMHVENKYQHYSDPQKTRVVLGAPTPYGRAIGVTQILSSTAKMVDPNLDPMDEVSNWELGLRYYKSLSKDPVERRLRYVGGGQKVIDYYRKNGTPPDWRMYPYLKGNKATYKDYVDGGGGAKLYGKTINQTPSTNGDAWNQLSKSNTPPSDDAWDLLTGKKQIVYINGNTDINKTPPLTPQPKTVTDNPPTIIVPPDPSEITKKTDADTQTETAPSEAWDILTGVKTAPTTQQDTTNPNFVQKRTIKDSNGNIWVESSDPTGLKEGQIRFEGKVKEDGTRETIVMQKSDKSTEGNELYSEVLTDEQVKERTRLSSQLRAKDGSVYTLSKEQPPELAAKDQYQFDAVDKNGKPIKPVILEKKKDGTFGVVGGSVQKTNKPIATSKRLVPVKTQTPQPTQVQPKKEYEFERTKEITLDNGKKLKYDPDAQEGLQEGEYRAFDEKSNPVRVIPAENKMFYESTLITVLDTKIPLADRNSKTYPIAKAELAQYVGNLVSAKFEKQYPELTAANVTDYFNAYGFTNLDTGKASTPDEYFAKSAADTTGAWAALTGVSNTKYEPFRLTQYDLDQIRDFVAKKLIKNTEFQNAVQSFILDTERNPEHDIYIANQYALAKMGLKSLSNVENEITAYRKEKESYNPQDNPNDIEALPRQLYAAVIESENVGWQGVSQQDILRSWTKAHLDKVVKDYGSVLAKQEADRQTNELLAKMPWYEKGIEALSNLYKLVPEAAGSVLETAGIGQAILTGQKADTTNLYKLGESTKWIGEYLLPKDKIASQSNIAMAADTLGQVGLQALAAWATGGVTVPTIMGGSMAASQQYEEAKKAGATEFQRKVVALIGFAAAVPDAIIMNGWFKGLTGGQKGLFLNRLRASIFQGLLDKWGATEANMAMRSAWKVLLDKSIKAGLVTAADLGETVQRLTFVNGAVTIAKGSAFESIQEVSENKIDAIAQKFTYKKDLSWDDITSLTDDDVYSFYGGLLGGAFGGGIEVTTTSGRFKNWQEKRVALKQIDEAFNNPDLKLGKSNKVYLFGKEFELTGELDALATAWGAINRGVKDSYQRTAQLVAKAQNAKDFATRRALVEEIKAEREKALELASNRDSVMEDVVKEAGYRAPINNVQVTSAVLPQGLTKENAERLGISTQEVQDLREFVTQNTELPKTALVGNLRKSQDQSTLDKLALVSPTTENTNTTDEVKTPEEPKIPDTLNADNDPLATSNDESLTTKTKLFKKSENGRAPIWNVNVNGKDYFAVKDSGQWWATDENGKHLTGTQNDLLGYTKNEAVSQLEQFHLDNNKPEEKKGFLGAYFPATEAAEFNKLGNDLVTNADLYTDEKGFGREDTPHNTIFYGINENDNTDFAEMFKSKQPLTVTLGKVNVFEGKDTGKPYDVVYVETEGQGLRDAHEMVKERTDNSPTHGDFTPHATVAYVKAGEGAKYKGDTRFEGKTITINEVHHEDSFGNTNKYPLAAQITVSESQTALDTQAAAASNEAVNERIGVLYSGEDESRAPKKTTRTDYRIVTPNGVLMVNRQQADARFGNRAGLLTHIAANGYQNLLGRVEDVGSKTTDGTTVSAIDETGKQIDSAVVTNPENVEAQATSFTNQYGSTIQIVEEPVQDAIAHREADKVKEGTEKKPWQKTKEEYVAEYVEKEKQRIRNTVALISRKEALSSEQEDAVQKKFTKAYEAQIIREGEEFHASEVWGAYKANEVIPKANLEQYPLLVGADNEVKQMAKVGGIQPRFKPDQEVRLEYNGRQVEGQVVNLAGSKVVVSLLVDPTAMTEPIAKLYPKGETVKAKQGEVQYKVDGGTLIVNKQLMFQRFGSLTDLQEHVVSNGYKDLLTPYEGDGEFKFIEVTLPVTKVTPVYELNALIGKRGATRMMDANQRMVNLNLAKVMEDSGKVPSTIWMATGWERGTDGKWRTELDDSNYGVNETFTFKMADEEFHQHPLYRHLVEERIALAGQMHDYTKDAEYRAKAKAEFDIVNAEEHEAYLEYTRNKKDGMPLGEVINHPQLFEAYPQMKDWKVKVKKLSPSTGAQYSRGSHTITINKSYMGNDEFIRTALIHEIQHGIQEIEGFARGGNPNEFIVKYTPNKNDIDIHTEYIKGFEEALGTLKLIVDTHGEGTVDFLRSAQFLDENNKPHYVPANVADVLEQFVDHLSAGITLTEGGSRPTSVSDSIEFLEKEMAEWKQDLKDLQDPKRIKEKATQHYFNLAGEVEARNVEKRLNIVNRELLRRGRPRLTESVDRKNQIILYARANGMTTAAALAALDPVMFHQFAPEIFDGAEMVVEDFARTKGAKVNDEMMALVNRVLGVDNVGLALKPETFRALQRGLSKLVKEFPEHSHTIDKIKADLTNLHDDTGGYSYIYSDPKYLGEEQFHTGQLLSTKGVVDNIQSPEFKKKYNGLLNSPDVKGRFDELGYVDDESVRLAELVAKVANQDYVQFGMDIDAALDFTIDAARDMVAYNNIKDVEIFRKINTMTDIVFGQIQGEINAREEQAERRLREEESGLRESYRDSLEQQGQEQGGTEGVTEKDVAEEFARGYNEVYSEEVDTVPMSVIRLANNHDALLSADPLYKSNALGVSTYKYEATDFYDSFYPSNSTHVGNQYQREWSHSERIDQYRQQKKDTIAEARRLHSEAFKDAQEPFIDFERLFSDAEYNYTWLESVRKSLSYNPTTKKSALEQTRDMLGASYWGVKKLYEDLQVASKASSTDILRNSEEEKRLKGTKFFVTKDEDSRRGYQKSQVDANRKELKEAITRYLVNKGINFKDAGYYGDWFSNKSPFEGGTGDLYGDKEDTGWDGLIKNQISRARSNFIDDLKSPKNILRIGKIKKEYSEKVKFLNKLKGVKSRYELLDRLEQDQSGHQLFAKRESATSKNQAKFFPDVFEGVNDYRTRSDDKLIRAVDRLLNNKEAVVAKVLEAHSNGFVIAKEEYYLAARNILLDYTSQWKADRANKDNGTLDITEEELANRSVQIAELAFAIDDIGLATGRIVRSNSLFYQESPTYWYEQGLKSGNFGDPLPSELDTLEEREKEIKRLRRELELNHKELDDVLRQLERDLKQRGAISKETMKALLKTRADVRTRLDFIFDSETEEGGRTEIDRLNRPDYVRFDEAEGDLVKEAAMLFYEDVYQVDSLSVGDFYDRIDALTKNKLSLRQLEAIHTQAIDKVRGVKPDTVSKPDHTNRLEHYRAYTKIKDGLKSLTENTFDIANGTIENKTIAAMFDPQKNPFVAANKDLLIDTAIKFQEQELNKKTEVALYIQKQLRANGVEFNRTQLLDMVSGTMVLTSAAEDYHKATVKQLNAAKRKTNKESVIKAAELRRSRAETKAYVKRLLDAVKDSGLKKAGNAAMRVQRIPTALLMITPRFVFNNTVGSQLLMTAIATQRASTVLFDKLTNGTFDRRWDAPLAGETLRSQFGLALATLTAYRGILKVAGSWSWARAKPNLKRSKHEESTNLLGFDTQEFANTKVMNKIYEQDPFLQGSLLGDIISEIALDHKELKHKWAEYPVRAAEWLVEKGLKIARVSEIQIRQEVFLKALTGRLKAQDIDLQELIDTGRVGDIERQDIDVALSLAKKAGFAYNPIENNKYLTPEVWTDAGAIWMNSQINKVVKATPYVSERINPVRFAKVSTTFAYGAYRTTPAPLVVGLARAASGGKVRADDIGSAIPFAVLQGIALLMRAAGGDKEKDKDGKTTNTRYRDLNSWNVPFTDTAIDMSNFPVFGFHYWLSGWYTRERRWERLFEGQTYKDFAQSALGLKFIWENSFWQWLTEHNPDEETSSYRNRKFMGANVKGLLNPLQGVVAIEKMVRAAGGFEKRADLDPYSAPFWSEVAKNIPLEDRVLGSWEDKYKQDLITGKPKESSSWVRDLTGFQTIDPLYRDPEKSRLLIEIEKRLPTITSPPESTREGRERSLLSQLKKAYRLGLMTKEQVETTYRRLVASGKLTPDTKGADALLENELESKFKKLSDSAVAEKLLNLFATSKEKEQLGGALLNKKASEIQQSNQIAKKQTLDSALLSKQAGDLTTYNLLKPEDKKKIDKEMGLTDEQQAFESRSADARLYLFNNEPDINKRGEYAGYIKKMLFDIQKKQLTQGQQLTKGKLPMSPVTPEELNLRVALERALAKYNLDKSSLPADQKAKLNSLEQKTMGILERRYTLPLNGKLPALK